MKRAAVLLGTVACILALAGGDAPAEGRFAALGGDGGNGPDINLIVREVRVSPVRAHVGDAIRVDMVIENRGEGYGTDTARVYANGKPVASRLFTYDALDGPSALYRESFVWDTRGARPGEYRIRAEAFDWNDSSPFDNFMDVKQPVVLVPAGAAFPGGRPAGGEAVELDPRWRPDQSAFGADPRNPGAPRGITGETESGRRR
ncbi:MAG: hypothetical protein ACM3NF_03400 [Gemmatimonadota bacterium]